MMECFKDMKVRTKIGLSRGVRAKREVELSSMQENGKLVEVEAKREKL